MSAPGFLRFFRGGASPRRSSVIAAGVWLSTSLLFAGCSGGGSTAPGAAPQAGVGALGLRTIKTVKPNVGVTGLDATILGDNPVAFYRLNDTSTTLADASPNALNGTYGSAVGLGVPGLTSMYYPSASFPGGNYSASVIGSVPPSPLLQPTMVTVDTWIKPSGYNTSNRFEPVVAYGRFSTGTPYHISITAINQFYFSVHTSNGAPSVVAKTTSTPGHIYHLVGTYDGSTIKLYVNGALEAQTAASGPIIYVGEFNWTGLAIGSGFDSLSSHPIQSFAGTIGSASVYNYPLTATQVMNHYLSGVQAPPITETGAPADSFVDSIGVNASFNYQGTAYDTQFNTVESLLVASGIRHIRTGITTTWPTYITRLNTLAQAGIHSQLVTQGTEPASLLTSYPAQIPQSIEAYEGPNEPDESGNQNWLADTTSFMQTLYSAVKGNSATANLKIVGPSVVTPAGQAAIGNLGAYMDYGNMHPYFGTNNPGNTGTGSVTPFGRSGSLAYYSGEAAQVSGTKPLFATETGYGTMPSISGNVSEMCDGKEAPRTYFDFFKSGVPRTMPYQLIEQETAYGTLGFFSYMGFLHQDLSPKPSYNAVKSLISLLSDKGTPFTPAPLTYTIRGNVNNLQHELLQKRNGTYYLALWLEVPSWDPVNNVDVNAPAQSVTIDVPATVSTTTLSSLSDLGTMTSSTITPSLNSVTVPVSDRITVLAFHP